MMLPIEKGHIIDMLIGENKIGIFKVLKVEEKHIWGVKLEEYYIKDNIIRHDHMQETIIECIPIVEPFNIFGFEYNDDVYLESKYLAESILKYVLCGDENVLFFDK